jgi:hypothetical protein
MSKCFKRQRMNSLSILFHHGLVKILLLSHLSQTGDNWESFLRQNGFSHTDDTVNPPLDINPSFDSLVTESQGFNSPDGYEINESVSISLKTPMVKKSRCIFSSRKSLEQVVDELKGKFAMFLQMNLIKIIMIN